VADDRRELDAWIAELRGRSERDEQAHLGPVDVAGVKVDGGLAVRIMLADLDHLDMLPPAWADDPLVTPRRAALLADFRLLRAQIG